MRRLPVMPASVSGIGMSLASFRRFWAVAARWNSPRAPFGPRDALEMCEQHLDRSDRLVEVREDRSSVEEGRVIGTRRKAF
jgi:hypothetical protein